MAAPPDPDTLAKKVFVLTLAGAVASCVAAAIYAF